MSTIITEFDMPAPPAPIVPPVQVRAGARNILALDLGTKCGWAAIDTEGKTRSGTVSFAPRKADGPGQRWLKFAAHLGAVKRQLGEIHVVYYEIVMAHGTKQMPNTTAAHVYGAFEAQVQIFCDINRIRLVPVGVGTVKKHWTGKGNAKKEDMEAEARRRGFKPADDNEADALAILDLAIKLESK